MALKTFFDTHDVGEPFPDGFPKEDQEWIKTEERKFARELMMWYRSVIKRVAESITDNGVRKGNISDSEASIWGRFDSKILWSELSEDLRRMLQGFYDLIINRSKWAKPRGAEIQIDMDYLDMSIIENARKNAASLVSGITEEVRKQIRDQVFNGLNEGKKVSEVRDGILSLSEGAKQIFKPERALRIASTEMIRAYNQGAVIRYKSSGVVRGMKWISASVGYCPRCGALDGKVVPLGEAFYFDPKFGDGLPPRHPHCRCTIAPITLKEAKESNIAELQNDYRNSVSELWDNDAYTMVNGVKITGGARGHYMRRHALEVNGRLPDFKDLDEVEKLMVDMLNGDYGIPTTTTAKDKIYDHYIAPIEGHHLQAVVTRNNIGEKILLTLKPVK